MPLKPIATDDRRTPHGTQTHEELTRFRLAMETCGDAIYLVDRAAMYRAKQGRVEVVRE